MIMMKNKKISLTAEIKELKEINKKQFDLLGMQNKEIIKLIQQISVLQSIVNLENKETTGTIYIPSRIQ
ncbi:MAG TPA: hypothetical protein VKR58_15115 [Aquella sp.]|nr:hypothetical protein [Aquella sp.]